MLDRRVVVLVHDVEVLDAQRTDRGPTRECHTPMKEMIERAAVGLEEAHRVGGATGQVVRPRGLEPGT